MDKRMISVDQWSSGSQIYFLTHLHADHTVGLSSRWNRGPLYCSRITARLFHPKFPGFDLSLLRVLEIGRWYSLSLVSPTTGLETKVQVMAIDANHCPGAFMYLFRGEFGVMLYTGDFRWEVSSEIAQMGKTMLLNALKNDKIDTLYIDNTYCNPSYSFPSREVAAQQVVNIINSYPEHDIIIGIDSLGKEDLLLYISKMLKIKIWVWPERLQTMHLLGLHDNFTTKTTLTRVRAVPRYSFSVETLEGLNTMRPTIGIMPSGLPWALKKAGCKDKSCDLSSMKTETSIDHHMNMRNRYTNNIEKHHQYIYTVPYSDHSCFPEILEFVKFLRPSNIKGIVSSSSSYIDPCYHLRNIIGSSSLYQHPVIEEERKSVEGKCKSDLACNSFTEDKLKSKRIKKYLLCRKTRVSVLRRILIGLNGENIIILESHHVLQVRVLFFVFTDSPPCVMYRGFEYKFYKIQYWLYVSASDMSHLFVLLSLSIYCPLSYHSHAWQKVNCLMAFMLLLCFSMAICFTSAADTISANHSLSGDQTIISKHDNFVLGFFKAGNSSNYYVGIWYKKVASNPPTIVWVANREIPVSDRLNSELKIVDGNLVLLNELKLQIWSTNVTTTNLNSVIAVIRDDGNLVLTDGSNSVEPDWQSFDHLVNTWLPGAKIAYDFRTKKKQLLTSWKTEENPDAGLFSLELDPTGKEYICKRNGSHQYWTSGAWNGHI
ncbi:5' exonuclease Apollo [Tanacetum coccineum]